MGFKDGQVCIIEQKFQSHGLHFYPAWRIQTAFYALAVQQALKLAYLPRVYLLHITNRPLTTVRLFDDILLGFGMAPTDQKVNTLVTIQADGGAISQTYLSTCSERDVLVKPLKGDLVFGTSYLPVTGLTDLLKSMTVEDKEVQEVAVNGIVCGSGKKLTIKIWGEPSAPQSSVYWTIENPKAQTYEKFFEQALIKFVEAKSLKRGHVAFGWLVADKKMKPADAEALTLQLASFVTTFRTLHDGCKSTLEHLQQYVAKEGGCSPEDMHDIKCSGQLCLYIV